MIDPSPGVVLPRAYWYVVSGVVLVAGLGLASWQVQRSTVLGSADTAKTVRGSGLVQLDGTGSHSLYILRRASERLDASTENALHNAKTATINVRDDRTGLKLVVRRIYETDELRGNLMARLAEFEVPAPGTFRVEITPSLEELRPFVRPSVPVEKLGQEVVGLIVGVLVGLGIGAIATIVAATVFVIVLRRRKRFTKAMARSSISGGGTY